MNISIINTSMPEYGTDTTSLCLKKEAEKRGHRVSWNVIDGMQDFFIINMFGIGEQDKFKIYLRPKKFIYIEHSLEALLPEKKYIRNFIMPNSLKNYFFSPRHRTHLEDGVSYEYKHLFKENFDYLICPVDYNFWKPIEGIEREETLHSFVGFLHSNKGVYDILKIAKSMPNEQFIFAGQGGGDIPLDVFERFPTVKYIGHQSPEQLRELYSRAKDLYILPTNGAVESASRVVFESVFCGCTPIVNNDVGNASWEWFRDRNAIIKHMDFSVNQLFKTIERSLKNIGDSDGK